MIDTREIGPGYRQQFSNGGQIAHADMPKDRGGEGEGFRPHELLEAALATCMSMTVRMAAEKYGIALAHVAVRVTLDRSVADDFAFDYQLTLPNELTAEQRARLVRAAAQCPVSKTLAAAPRVRQAK